MGVSDMQQNKHFVLEILLENFGCLIEYFGILVAQEASSLMYVPPSLFNFTNSRYIDISLNGHWLRIISNFSWIR